MMSSSSTCSRQFLINDRDWIEFHGEFGFLHFPTADLRISPISIPGITIFDIMEINRISAFAQIGTPDRPLNWKYGSEAEPGTLLALPVWFESNPPPFGWDQIRVSEGNLTKSGFFNFNVEGMEYSVHLMELKSLLPVGAGSSGGGIFEVLNRELYLVGVTQSSTLSSIVSLARFQTIGA